MKKILSILVVLALCFVPMAFAVENGAGVKWGQVTLTTTSQGTAGMGVTSAVILSPYTFDNVMKYGACDLISGPSSGTSNVTIVIKGNQGSSSTLFDGTAYLLASTTMASSATLTVMKTVTFASGVAAPFRTISATVTSPTTTQNIILNCSAIQ